MGSSQAEQGAMHNCPQAGRWAISVWSGQDGTETGEALDTCDAGAIAAAYYLDPQRQGWSRWFAGQPGLSTLARLDNLQGVIALGAVGAPPPAATPTPTVMPVGTWTGVWETTYGNMELSQSDGSVTGTYEVNQGKIEGTVQGNKLVGTWSEPPSYAPPDEAGEFEFTLSPDGNSFVGRFRYDSSGDWGEWTGTRIG